MQELLRSIMIDGHNIILGILEEIDSNIERRSLLAQLELKVGCSCVYTQRPLLIQAPRRLIETSSGSGRLPRALQGEERGKEMSEQSNDQRKRCSEHQQTAIAAMFQKIVRTLVSDMYSRAGSD